MLATLILFLCAAVVLCSAFGKSNVETASVTADCPSYRTKPVDAKDIRAVWINYLEFGEMIRDNDLSQFTQQAEKCLDNLIGLSINTVYLHIRSHCDAFYESEIFPYSYQISGKQGQGCGYDPLGVFLELAHKREIRVEGWINPYRVAGGRSGLSGIAENSPIWDFSFDDGEIVTIDTGTFLNPSCKKSADLIVKGVDEVLCKYNVDGIHFDDYFYPSADESFDKKIYEKYSSSTENPLSLADFRRNSVTDMIKSVYERVKKKDQTVFSISPAADIEKDKNVLFADVEKWCLGGYCDFICPQIYFGFEYPKEGFDFLSLLEKWQSLCRDGATGLVVGLAPYKIGKSDRESREWIDCSDILKRQTEQAAEIGAGVSFYNYTALFSEQEQNTAQRENLRSALNQTPPFNDEK